MEITQFFDIIVPIKSVFLQLGWGGGAATRQPPHLGAPMTDTLHVSTLPFRTL